MTVFRSILVKVKAVLLEVIIIVIFGLAEEPNRTKISLLLWVFKLIILKVFLTEYLHAYEGTFWVQRFKDAWDSCSQKKAVAFGVFTLVWNFSSVVARIWAGKVQIFSHCDNTVIDVFTN